MFLFLILKARVLRKYAQYFQQLATINIFNQWREKSL